MKNDYLQNMPDFSQFAEIAQKTQEMIRSVAEAALRVQEIVRPIVEIAAKYREQVTAALVGMAELARPITAVRIMGESQFVYWDTLVCPAHS